MTVSLDDEEPSGESSGEPSGGFHWIVNIDDMIERGLDHPEYLELMKGEGKVIEFQPVGVSDFPSVLVGFTKEQVNEILLLFFSLPLSDLLETVHSVLRRCRIPYECKNLLGTDTYIFDFPQIEGGRLMYLEVRPKLISPGYSLYDGFSFPDATYDHWGEWGRLLHSQMTRRNWKKATDYWLEARQAAMSAVVPTEVDETALGIRAKQLRVRRDTLLRWERILQDHLPKGLTQVQIAELEDRDTRTIKGDYERMREKGMLPPLPEKSTPKLAP